MPAGASRCASRSAEPTGGTKDGAYSAYVTATGGGQSVRTAAAVDDVVSAAPDGGDEGGRRRRRTGRRS